MSHLGTGDRMVGILARAADEAIDHGQATLAIAYIDFIYEHFEGAGAPNEDIVPSATTSIPSERANSCSPE